MRVINKQQLEQELINERVMKATGGDNLECQVNTTVVWTVIGLTLLGVASIAQVILF